MVRMTKKTALNTAMEIETIPGLSLGDNLKAIKERYSSKVVTTTLQLLGVPEKKARTLACNMNGCPRVRLDKALRRLRYGE